MVKDFKKFSIPITIIFSGLIIAGAFIFVNQEKNGELISGETSSPEEVAQKVLDYINQNILSEGLVATLIEVTEENWVYKIHLKIGEEEYDSYVTKDGKILFPQGVDLEEISETQTQVPEETEPTEGDSSLQALAECLKQKGMKFYGASWCGWCNKQKELFGEAAQYLPYIECSDPETEELTSECQEAGITGFPTWELPDGTKSSGFKTFEDLTGLSGCSP